MDAALAITLVAAVVRLVVAAFTPLFPDETYYWDWSRHLAAGYCDHPPAIAWAVRAGTFVAGDTSLGVRLVPVVLGAVAVWFACLTARRLYGDRAATLTAILFAAMPLSAAGLVLATPDAPMLATCAATLYAVVRALDAPLRSRESLKWWSAAGVALGLAMTSKYTAVLLPLGVFGGLLSRRDLRLRLAAPGPYLATLIGMVVFLPVITWNARHDWASFAFQLQHGLGSVGGSAINRVLEMLGGQAGLVSPVLFVMMAIAVVRAWRSTPVDRVLAFAAVFVIAFFMYSATKRRVEANWPALAYLPATLLLAAYASRQRSTAHEPRSTVHRQRWLNAGIGLAAAISLVTYVNAFTPILPVPATRDPQARAAGWPDLADAVNRMYEPRLSISSYRTWVAADRYQETSMLAFHLPNKPEAFSLNLNSRPNQYDLWPRFTDRAYPRDGLILVLDDQEVSPVIERLAPHFEQAHRGELVTLRRNGELVKNFRVWHLERWRGTWPQRALPSGP